MHTLTSIRDNEGARKRRKTVGRGIGSGHGKTSCRGGKGQTARSGVAINGFEGGQNPIYRRLPKRGFKSHLKVPTFEMDFNTVQRFIDSGCYKSGDKIDRTSLIEKGIISKSTEAVVVLNNGELKVSLHFAVTKATAKAKAAIEAAGGSVTFE
ncbi:MAG: 50S ribosomal protein L15 [Holosporales bacterium]